MVLYKSYKYKTLGKCRFFSVMEKVAITYYAAKVVLYSRTSKWICK